nr:hypothetical protein GCM10020093_024130 [Planobispora longispora]
MRLRDADRGPRSGTARRYGAGVDRTFTVEEARAMMPAVMERADAFVRMRGDLAELAQDLRDRGESERGGLAEVKALEARLGEILGWFVAHGLEVKGVAPLLVDFPRRSTGSPYGCAGSKGTASWGGTTATSSASPPPSLPDRGAARSRGHAAVELPGEPGRAGGRTLPAGPRGMGGEQNHDPSLPGPTRPVVCSTGRPRSGTGPAPAETGEPSAAGPRTGTAEAAARVRSAGRTSGRRPGGGARRDRARPAPGDAADRGRGAVPRPALLDRPRAGHPARDPEELVEAVGAAPPGPAQVTEDEAADPPVGAVEQVAVGPDDVQRAERGVAPEAGFVGGRGAVSVRPSFRAVRLMIPPRPPRFQNAVAAASSLTRNMSRSSAWSRRGTLRWDSR